MPWAWVNSPLVLEHKGVKIYGIFKNDIVRNTISPFKYGYTQNCDDNGTDCFDVRFLPTYSCDKTHTQIICEAIDQGVLTQTGIVVSPGPETREA
jgi:hypothetical protein